jgi:hypothetical protein
MHRQDFAFNQRKMAAFRLQSGHMVYRQRGEIGIGPDPGAPRILLCGKQRPGAGAAADRGTGPCRTGFEQGDLQGSRRLAGKADSGEPVVPV